RLIVSPAALGRCARRLPRRHGTKIVNYRTRGSVTVDAIWKASTGKCEIRRIQRPRLSYATGVRTEAGASVPNSNAKPLPQRVQAVIAAIRPAVLMDGGDLELVGVDERGVVSVRLLGACVGCPASAMTLKMGIEQRLRDEIPEVREVVCV